jgi:hypothetical protein
MAIDLSVDYVAGIPGDRDAVHVSVVLSVCAESRLMPGDKVRFTDTTLASVVKVDDDDYDGIVNPFGTPVEKGWTARIIIRPNRTSNVRHVFDVTLYSGNLAKYDKPQNDPYVNDYDDEYDECRHC